MGVVEPISGVVSCTVLDAEVLKVLNFGMAVVTSVVSCTVPDAEVLDCVVRLVDEVLGSDLGVVTTFSSVVSCTVLDAEVLSID